MKINVVGTSGSGKSTVARALAEKLGCPCVEMDALFWLPNWHGREDPDFFARLEEALNGDAWVLDGNYNRTREIKWKNVDMVVWVDYGFCRTFVQAVRRACRRILDRQELWPGTGNRESLRQTFFSRDSILLWTLRTFRKNRRDYLATMNDPRYARFRFVRLRSPRETETFIESL